MLSRFGAEGVLRDGDSREPDEGPETTASGDRLEQGHSNYGFFARLTLPCLSFIDSRVKQKRNHTPTWPSLAMKVVAAQPIGLPPFLERCLTPLFREGNANRTI